MYPKTEIQLFYYIRINIILIREYVGVVLHILAYLLFLLE